jgi:hypothetical protein
MRVAYAKGQQGGQVGLGRFRAYALNRQWPLVIRLQRGWKRVPYRAFAVSFHAVYRSIKHPMGLFAKRNPIGGV